MKKNGRGTDSRRLPIGHSKEMSSRHNGPSTPQVPTVKGDVVGAANTQTPEQLVPMRYSNAAGTASYADVARYSAVKNAGKQTGTTKNRPSSDGGDAREQIETPILQPSLDQSEVWLQNKPSTCQSSVNQSGFNNEIITPTSQLSSDDVGEPNTTTLNHSSLDPSHMHEQDPTKISDFQHSSNQGHEQNLAAIAQRTLVKRHEETATPPPISALDQSHNQDATATTQPSLAQRYEQNATPTPQSLSNQSHQQSPMTNFQRPLIQAGPRGVRAPPTGRLAGPQALTNQPLVASGYNVTILPARPRNLQTFESRHMTGIDGQNGVAIETRQQNLGTPGHRNLMGFGYPNLNAATEDGRRVRENFQTMHDLRTNMFRTRDQPWTSGSWIPELAPIPLQPLNLFPRRPNDANVNPTSEFPSLSGNVPAQIGSANAWNGSSLRQRSPERPARGFGRGAGRIQDDAQRSNFAPGADGYRFGSGQTNSTTNRGTRGGFSAAQVSEQEPTGYAARSSAQDSQAAPNNDTATSPATERTSTANDASHPASKRISEMTEQEKYGMAAVLAQINSNHPDHNPLLAGFDLTKLGVQMDSAEPLMPTWPGPFDEQHLAVPDFSLPSAYTVTNVPPLPSKMDSMSDETIMMIFFQYPRDMLQQLAAEMLYKRDWRWHKIMRCWIKQDTSPQGGMYGAPVRLNEKQERGVYIVFDLNNWRRERKEMVLSYEDLDTRASLLAGAGLGAIGFHGAAGAQLNGQNGSAVQGLGMGGSAGAAFGGAFAQGGMPNV